MPATLIHKPTQTLFFSNKKNKVRYLALSEAVFPISECEEWKENFPQLAIAMPPEVGQVVAHGEHIFTVLNRSRERDTLRVKLWHKWDANTRAGEWYWIDECVLVTDELIEQWVEAIALHRQYKEDSPEYQAFIKRVPASIRDLCIVRSFNKVMNLLPVPPEVNGYF